MTDKIRLWIKEKVCDSKNCPFVLGKYDPKMIFDNLGHIHLGKPHTLDIIKNYCRFERKGSKENFIKEIQNDNFISIFLKTDIRRSGFQIPYSYFIYSKDDSGNEYSFDQFHAAYQPDEQISIYQAAIKRTIENEKCLIEGNDLIIL